MKRILILSCLCIPLCIQQFCAQTGGKYLDLDVQEAHKVGLILNDHGLYYKNQVPGKDKTLGFCCNEKYYSLITSSWDENDITVGNDTVMEYDSNFISLDTTNYDFYPLFITNQHQKASYADNSDTLHHELIPVRIFMENAPLANRNDTIIVWFTPTEHLFSAIPSYRPENYLQVPRIEHKKCDQE